MDKQLSDAAVQFLSHFELVFGQDWCLTRSILRDPEYYIKPDGTFVNPGVKDDEDNWANRARLLDAYRRLRVLLNERGVEFTP